MHLEVRKGPSTIPIFDTTKMGDFLSIVCTWTFLPFSGALFKTYKRGIFGHGIALSTFDKNYLLGNIHWYSIGHVF